MNRSLIALAVFSCIAALASAGCGGTPSAANTELRKQNQSLQDQVATLQRQHDADVAQIQAQQSGHAVPTLPEDRLGELFTTHGIELKRLTGGASLEGGTTYDTGLLVAVVPTDEQGQPLKAAGSFEIDAFDLSSPQPLKVGHWTFTSEQARQAWLGMAFQYNYVLRCPWQQPPTHANLTLKVTFTDALTGRQFTSQTQVTVTPPPATQQSAP
jgi:hypothetical protein